MDEDVIHMHFQNDSGESVIADKNSSVAIGGVQRLMDKILLYTIVDWFPLK